MARLQRQDLAKEFEDLVKQEVKNHNDSILATNQAISQLRQDIQDLKEECAAKDAALTSMVSAYSSQFLDLSANLLRTKQIVFSKINDNYTSNNQQIASLKSAMDLKESYFLTHSDFERFRVKIDEWTAQIQRLFHVQNGQLSYNIDKAREAHIPQCNDLEKRLMKHLSDQIAEIEKINQSLDLFGINFNGLKLEIERLKKGCFIIEKNFENIYTQIERLKA